MHLLFQCVLLFVFGNDAEEMQFSLGVRNVTCTVNSC